MSEVTSPTHKLANKYNKATVHQKRPINKALVSRKRMEALGLADPILFDAHPKQDIPTLSEKHDQVQHGELQTPEPVESKAAEEALLAHHQEYLYKQAEMLTSHMVKKKLSELEGEIQQAVKKQMDVVVKRLCKKNGLSIEQP